MSNKLIEKEKTKEVFYGFNYDKMFKAIFVGFKKTEHIYFVNF